MVALNPEMWEKNAEFYALLANQNQKTCCKQSICCGFVNSVRLRQQNQKWCCKEWEIFLAISNYHLIYLIKVGQDSLPLLKTAWLLVFNT